MYLCSSSLTKNKTLKIKNLKFKTSGFLFKMSLLLLLPVPPSLEFLEGFPSQKVSPP